MAVGSNKLILFWQELKRRKVIKSMTMYAATAFIVIEASDIILPRLGLPDWTVTFLIILIIVGFPITLIFSWIYDVSPRGIEKTDAQSPEEEVLKVPARQKPKLKPSDFVIVALLVVVCILLYPKIFQKDQFEEFRDDQGRITLAVMPFENQTGDTTLNYYQRGISSYVSNVLGNSSQLSVRDEQSIFELTPDLEQVNYAGFTSSNEREMARMVKAETYLAGSYQGRDGTYLILVDLIDSKTGDKIWTDRIQGNLETSDYFQMADSLCRKIKDYLEIKAMKQEVDSDLKEAYTQSAEAYRYYMEGMNLVLLKKEEQAVRSLSKALDIDPEFTLAKFYIAWAYTNNQQIDSASIWTKRAWETRENLPLFYQNWLELWYVCLVSKNIEEVRDVCQQLQQTETESKFFWCDLGITQHQFLDDHANAIKSFERVERVCAERDSPWYYLPYYQFYAMALHAFGNHQKEQEIIAQGLALFPQDLILVFTDASCAVFREDWTRVRGIEKMMTDYWNAYGVQPDYREQTIGFVFEAGGKLDSAEIHLRKAYELAPDNPIRKRSLATLLIEYDLNVREGVELLQSISNPLFLDDSFYLYSLGWGLLKLGEAEEALPLLIKARNVYPNASLKHDLRVSEAEQALLSQADP